MTPSTLTQIGLVTKHELAITFRTKRAVALTVLYMAAAVFGGLAYIMAVRLIEQQATKLLTEQGADPATAANAVSLAGQQAYQQLVAFFAGADPASIAPAISNSVVLPAFLWASLAFLPFLVLLTSFDQVAADLSSRALCYSTLRTPRYAVLLGKLLAQTTLYFGLTALGSLALVGLGAGLLQSFAPVDAMVGVARLWILLLPYGFAYLGLSAFTSSSFKQPALALFSALGIMIALRVLGWMRHVPEDSSYAVLRYARWLSPATYQDGLWQAGFAGPLSSTAAYLAFGAVFTLLAYKRLEAVDL